MKIALGKACKSLNEAQARYKKTFKKRVRRVRKLKPDDKFYLDIEEVGSKQAKLSPGVVGAFRILKVDKDIKIFIIQREDFVERVAMNRVVRAPASAPIEDSSPNLQATPKDLEEKVTERKKVGHEEDPRSPRTR